MKRGHRTDREVSKVKLISGFRPGAKLTTAGAAVGGSEQPLSAGTIGIVPAVGRGIEIETFVKIGKIKSSAAAINVDVTGWLEVGPSMGVPAQYPDSKIVGDSVVRGATGWSAPT